MKFKISKELTQKIAAIVLLVALAIFAYTRYFFLPTWDSIKVNKKKTVELTRRVEELERQAARRDRLLAEIVRAEEIWTALKTKLPEKQDLPGILKTINQISRKYRLRVGTINPIGVSSVDLYNEIPLGLTVTGSYHDIALFLEAMGKMERIFHARDLTLNPTSAPADAPWISTNATLTLVTFQYKGG